MKNTVRYSDSRVGDRIEILLGTALAVAGLVAVAIWLVNFGQLLHEFKRSVTPALWRLRGGGPLFVPLAQQQTDAPFRPQIPKTWDDAAVASLEVPLAVREASPVQIDSSAYYKLPVGAIHKSYSVYHPSQEPAGYFEWLEQQKPEIAFDPTLLETKEDWIRAGELVFDAPIGFGGIAPRPDNQYLRDPSWYQATGSPVAADGTLPFYRYVIREKGKVEIGVFSCGMCHTRVMANGAIVKGAQGNFPSDRALALDSRQVATALKIDPATDLVLSRAFERSLYAAPWIRPDPYPIDQLSKEDLASLHEAIPPGVLARHGTSPRTPARIPDLIGIQDRRYLDATGLVQHRGIGDLMRYAALNQGTDVLARYGDFSPIDEVAKLLPDSRDVSRYSEEQLYALALYIYSLEPPPNPNKFDALAERGEAVFKREACAGCHTPPLYTNNKLTPAAGFKVPEDHLRKYDILQVSVGTNPDLTTKTRRGTGYYKVPSLKGVWYRGPFEHNGSVATLEDWFDPRRLRDDYVPTGFVGYGLKTRAVKGHEYGLKLTPEDKRALIAFLKTL